MHVCAIVAAALLLANWGGGDGARAQSALCAKVRLEIPQTLTLERDAFAAKLVITNNLPDVPLEDIAVTLEIETAAGDDASTIVFVGEPALTGVTSIDGSGRVAAGTSATAEWLFVPTPGAGGVDPAGLGYRARATLHYRAGVAEADLVSTWADFTVMPQPLLELTYALPRWVESDDPFTVPVEPPVPFDLAVRVANVGHGEARAVRIASAQPRIVENQAGLLIDFEIVGGEVDGIPGPGSLMLDFGAIAAGACDTGAWVMKTTLEGVFTSLDVAFSHEASLGGADTSLIGGATTRWLLHRVHSEARGVLSEVDQQDDFLVEPANAPPLAPGLAVPESYEVLQLRHHHGAGHRALELVGPH